MANTGKRILHLKNYLGSNGYVAIDTPLHGTRKLSIAGLKSLLGITEGGTSGEHDPGFNTADIIPLIESSVNVETERAIGAENELAERIQGAAGGQVTMLDGLTSNWFDIIRAQVDGKLVHLRYDLGVVSVTSAPVSFGAGSASTITRIANAISNLLLDIAVSQIDSINSAITDYNSNNGTHIDLLTEDELRGMYNGSLPYARFTEISAALGSAGLGKGEITEEEYAAQVAALQPPNEEKIKAIINSILDRFEYPNEEHEPIDLTGLGLLSQYTALIDLDGLGERFGTLAGATDGMLDINVDIDIPIKLGGMGGTGSGFRIGLGLKYKPTMPIVSPSYLAVGMPYILCVANDTNFYQTGDGYARSGQPYSNDDTNDDNEDYESGNSGILDAINDNGLALLEGIPSGPYDEAGFTFLIGTDLSLQANPANPDDTSDDTPDADSNTSDDTGEDNDGMLIDLYGQQMRIPKISLDTLNINSSIPLDLSMLGQLNLEELLGIQTDINGLLELINSFTFTISSKLTMEAACRLATRGWDFLLMHSSGVAPGIYPFEMYTPLKGVNAYYGGLEFGPLAESSEGYGGTAPLFDSVLVGPPTAAQDDDKPWHITVHSPKAGYLRLGYQFGEDSSFEDLYDAAMRSGWCVAGKTYGGAIWLEIKPIETLPEPAVILRGHEPILGAPIELVVVADLDSETDANGNHAWRAVVSTDWSIYERRQIVLDSASLDGLEEATKLFHNVYAYLAVDSFVPVDFENGPHLLRIENAYHNAPVGNRTHGEWGITATSEDPQNFYLLQGESYLSYQWDENANDWVPNDGEPKMWMFGGKITKAPLYLDAISDDCGYHLNMRSLYEYVELAYAEYEDKPDNLDFTPTDLMEFLFLSVIEFNHPIIARTEDNELCRLVSADWERLVFESTEKYYTLACCEWDEDSEPPYENAYENGQYLKFIEADKDVAGTTGPSGPTYEHLSFDDESAAEEQVFNNNGEVTDISLNDWLDESDPNALPVPCAVQKVIICHGGDFDRERPNNDNARPQVNWAKVIIHNNTAQQDITIELGGFDGEPISTYTAEHGKSYIMEFTGPYIEWREATNMIKIPAPVPPHDEPLYN